VTEWPSEHDPVPKMSSQISAIELTCACRRIDETFIGSATSVLDTIDVIPIDQSLVELAAVVGPNGLKPLDARHLASALALREHLTAFVGYDKLLCDAARAEGFSVQSPREANCTFRVTSLSKRGSINGDSCIIESDRELR
jgi:uncharacterized protein